MELANSTAPKQARAGGINYGVMLFLLLTPIVGIVGTAVYTWINGFALWMPLLTLVMYLAVGMSICAGYHRFFSHKSYEASRPVQYVYAFFGAMAAQNSILWWSSSHRIHHQYVDRDWDPYNIKRGFWWAHIVWVFHRDDPPPFESNASDLLKNPVVMWQDRWHTAILIFGGFGIPALVGYAFGDVWAGILWGGFLRLVIIHHTTFFVNSLAHWVGDPSYNAEVSARDNWAVALLTLGEGYHSFHHRFPADYRNGIRPYHWDPAKWFITGLRAVGLASDLRSTPPPQIEQARMHAELRRIEAHLASDHKSATHVNELIAEAKKNLSEAFALWRQHLEERSSNATSAWRNTRRSARQRVREARRQWRQAVSMALAASETA